MTLAADLQARFADVVLEERILEAAEAGDLIRFRRLVERLPGGLEAAQELVRTRGSVIRPTSSPPHVTEDD